MTELAFSSKPFKLTPAIYFRIAAGAQLPTLAAMAVLLLLVATVAAVLVDLRIIFIGLIIVLLVIPFVVVNIYFKKLLTPQARFALARKQVVARSDGSLVETFLPESDKPEEDMPDNEVDMPISPRIHSGESIVGVRRSGDFVVFSISPDYLLIVPVSDREEADQML